MFYICKVKQLKNNKMTKTIYKYETKGGVNVETFTSNGYVTLIQNGLFKYEHHFGSLGINLQEQLLVAELEKNNVKFTKTIK